MKRLAILAALTLSSCGGTRQNNAADLSQPDASSATVILSVTRPALLSSLMLAPYDPAQQRTTAGFMGGYVAFNLTQVSNGGYVWKRMKPGTYVLHSLLQQGIWDLCFAANTQAFTVGAGQTLYLGRFDPIRYTQALVQAVEAAGQTTVQTPRSGRVISYFDGVPPAAIAPDPAAITPAHTLAVSQAYTATNVTPAAFTPATFTPGTDYLGESGSLGAQTCFGANPGLDVSTAK